MRREDFVFCIGYEGSTAIVDGRLLRRHGSQTTRQLAEEGLYKQAINSAMFADSAQELDEVVAIFNAKTSSPVRSVEELKRIFGISGVPEGVKKVTVV
jgi:hypothetical protein